MDTKKYLSFSGLSIFYSNIKEWMNSHFVENNITINGKQLNSNIALSASDVGADASGSASTALADAKAYTDEKIANLDNSAPDSSFTTETWTFTLVDGTTVSKQMVVE